VNESRALRLGLGVAALVVLAGCGGARQPRSRPFAFCGLARTVNGFDLVAARGLTCAEARPAIAPIERGRRGGWSCSRAMHASFELRCRAGSREVRVLERAPVRVTRADGVARLGDWSFRLQGDRLLGRDGAGRWVSLGPPPWCIPFAGPREVLVALGLRPITPHGGCFRLHGSRRSWAEQKAWRGLRRAPRRA
jgi:hypothetical protein